MEMTCNQLILLLEIYRTGSTVRAEYGTTLSDLYELKAVGLVVGDGPDYALSKKGNKLVELLKTLSGLIGAL
jgi:predicted transcriptional regulator